MIIITDCRYRTAVSMFYALGKMGHRVAGVTTRSFPSPPSLYSRFVSARFVLPDDREEYKKELLALCKQCHTGDEKPVLLPAGAFTLAMISEDPQAFRQVALFCVPEKSALDFANDKNLTRKAAAQCGILTPRVYDSPESAALPAVVKPVCGEKLNLRAADRYIICRTARQVQSAYDHYRSMDTEVIIQEYLPGKGVGVSLLLDANSDPVSVFCHERLTEYPVSGGPSSCCQSIYHSGLAAKSAELLKAIGFTGIAMVEYRARGDDFYFLEINPRIWGSFPLAVKAGSDFLSQYVELSLGTAPSAAALRYRENVKMKYLLNNLAACFSYLKRGRLLRALRVLYQSLNPRYHDGVFFRDDRKPFLRYLFGSK